MRCVQCSVQQIVLVCQRYSVLLENATEHNIQPSGYFSKSELTFAYTEQQCTEILVDCSFSFYENHIPDFTLIG